MPSQLTESSEILDVFFSAMRQGYATKPKKGTIAELPGSKVIPFESGEFKLIDCYFTIPDNLASFGQTIIWHNNTPIWMMSYHGWYFEEAIPFLKRALSETYSKNNFFGGRGPHFFRDNLMTYINNVEKNDWKSFRGREEIFGPNGTSLGWHGYQGMILLPL